MQERIKELAYQAGIEFSYDPTETPAKVFVECWEYELNYFAASIIKDRIGVCEDYRGTEWGKIAECIGDNIREHFGIKDE